MSIIGWIRKGDKAACGGCVAEGVQSCTSRGVPYSFEGARMACRNNCVVAEGYAGSTLPNGRSRVLHGMKTSCGCPLYSTLNDIDGVGNEAADVIPRGFVQEHSGAWVGNSEGVTSSLRQDFDEQFLLLGGDGKPLAHTYFSARFASGEIIHGVTNSEGKTERLFTADPCHIEIHLGHIDR